MNLILRKYFFMFLQTVKILPFNYMKTLGFFGPYLKERDNKLSTLRKQRGAMWMVNSDQADIKPRNRIQVPQPAPKIKDVIGRALPYIGTYKNLDNKQQKVALIDDVSY